MEKVVYDCKGAVFGRFASVVAKDLLKGKSVAVINSGDAVISGDKAGFVEKVKAKRKMGAGSSLKGPRYARKEDLLVKRMIRGMLPWDRPKGREAYSRLRCFIGNGDLSDFELKSAKKFKHQMPQKYTTIKEIVRSL